MEKATRMIGAFTAVGLAAILFLSSSPTNTAESANARFYQLSSSAMFAGYVTIDGAVLVPADSRLMVPRNQEPTEQHEGSRASLEGGDGVQAIPVPTSPASEGREPEETPFLLEVTEAGLRCLPLPYSHLTELGVWVVDLDGLTRLVPALPSAPWTLSLHPSGRSLCCQDNSGSLRLYTPDLEFRTLASSIWGGGEPLDWLWSSDGSSLYVATGSPQAATVWAMSAEGFHAERLGRVLAFSGFLAATPDGILARQGNSVVALAPAGPMLIRVDGRPWVASPSGEYILCLSRETPILVHFPTGETTSVPLAEGRLLCPPVGWTGWGSRLALYARAWDPTDVQLCVFDIRAGSVQLVATILPPAETCFDYSIDPVFVSANDLIVVTVDREGFRDSLQIEPLTWLVRLDSQGE